MNNVGLFELAKNLQVPLMRDGMFLKNVSNSTKKDCMGEFIKDSSSLPETDHC